MSGVRDCAEHGSGRYGRYGKVQRGPRLLGDCDGVITGSKKIAASRFPMPPLKCDTL